MEVKKLELSSWQWNVLEGFGNECWATRDGWSPVQGMGSGVSRQGSFPRWAEPKSSQGPAGGGLDPFLPALEADSDCNRPLLKQNLKRKKQKRNLDGIKGNLICSKASAFLKRFTPKKCRITWWYCAWQSSELELEAVLITAFLVFLAYLHNWTRSAALCAVYPVWNCRCMRTIKRKGHPPAVCHHCNFQHFLYCIAFNGFFFFLMNLPNHFLNPVSCSTMRMII